MLARFPLVFAAGTLAVCSAANRDVYYQGPLAPLNTAPTFDRGYLAVYEQGGFSLYGPDGVPRYKAAPVVPGASSVFIGNVAVDAEGIAAVTLNYYVNSGEHGSKRAGGLALFDAQGKQVRFFSTGAYVPSQVAFAPDGSIYSLGYLLNVRWAEHPDYDILRKYSREGEELLAALPRSSVDPNPKDSQPDPVPGFTGLWGLRVTADRIGFWIFRDDLQRRQWIEADLRGRPSGRWKLNQDLGEFAVTSSGTLYANGYGHGGTRFDRKTSTWEPVPGMPDGMLLGADGNSLVFLNLDSNLVRYFPIGE